MPPAGDKGKRRTALDRESRKAIGKQLQSLYDQVVHEPIPDRFSDLLSRLDDAEGKASGG